MSFTSEQHPRLSSPAALRALAHPTRLRLLGVLQFDGPATATECGAIVGESPSSCSYHLRQLALHGFVEEVPTGDGRERRWSARVVGVDFDAGTAGGEEFEAASRLARAALLELGDDTVRAYVGNERAFSPAWREAATFSQATIIATPKELDTLARRLAELLAEYAPSARPAPPRGARPVDVVLRAVPRP